MSLVALAGPINLKNQYFTTAAVVYWNYKIYGYVFALTSGSLDGKTDLVNIETWHQHIVSCQV